MPGCGPEGDNASLKREKIGINLVCVREEVLNLTRGSLLDLRVGYSISRPDLASSVINQNIIFLCLVLHARSCERNLSRSDDALGNFCFPSTSLLVGEEIS